MSPTEQAASSKAPSSSSPGEKPAWKEKAAKSPLYRRVIPFLVATALIVYVGRKMDFHAFFAALSHLNYVAYTVFAVAWTLAVCAGDSFGTVSVYRLTTPNVRFGEFYIMRGASYLPSVLNYHLGQAFLTYMMARFFRVPLARMTGATILSYVSWLGCLLACMAVALPFTTLPKFYLPVILVSGLAYLTVIGIAPAWLTRISFLSPLFEAGLLGHAKALATRVPHLIVLVLGAWASFLFFHVDIPVGTAAVYLPILLVGATLPITPQGAGTRDAIGALFFASFAQGATAEERTANIAAATATWTVSSTVMLVVIGSICSRIVSRRLEALSTEVVLHVDESGASGVNANGASGEAGGVDTTKPNVPSDA